MTADLSFLKELPGRCPDCLLHEIAQGHRALDSDGKPTGCSNSGPLGTILGRKLAKAAMARTVAAHPAAVARVDAAIMRRVASRQPFSANSIRSELADLSPDERPVIGARMNALARKHCKKLGDEPSTDPGTHGKTVAIWQARSAA